MEFRPDPLVPLLSPPSPPPPSPQLIEFNPVDNAFGGDRAVSTYYLSNAVLGPLRNSMLDHDDGYQSGWCWARGDMDKWVWMDLGAVKQVGGIVTQCRASGGAKQCVSSYTVEVSTQWRSANDADWTFVEDGKVFSGHQEPQTSNPSSRHTSYFDATVPARWFKVRPITWIPDGADGVSCMRVGILAQN